MNACSKLGFITLLLILTSCKSFDPNSLNGDWYITQFNDNGKLVKMAYPVQIQNGSQVSIELEANRHNGGISVKNKQLDISAFMATRRCCDDPNGIKMVQWLEGPKDVELMQNKSFYRIFNAQGSVTLMPKAAYEAMQPATSAAAPMDLIMEQGPCYGECPTYMVTIKPDGTVLYDGRMYTNREGRVELKMDARTLAEIFGRVESLDWNEVQAEYNNIQVADLSTVRLQYGDHTTNISWTPDAPEALAKTINIVRDWLASEGLINK